MVDLNRHKRFIIIAPVLIFLIMIGVWVRIPPQANTIKNIDEVIPLLVHAGMRARGDINTDLSRTVPALPYNIGAVRYNFSAYLLATFFLTSEKTDEPHLRDLRFLNNIFFVATVIIFFAVCMILKMDLLSTTVGIAIICVAPGLVHDGQMARPETFLTLTLAVFVLGVAMSRRWLTYGFIVAGLGAGFAISTKFTFVMVVIPAFCLLLHYRLKIKYYSLISGIFLLALGIGFLIGLPYAVLNFKGFLLGIRELFTVYSSSYPPHSAADGSISLFRQIYFYLAIYGLIFISPLISFLFAGRLSASSSFLRHFFFSLACLYVGFLLILGISPVFFERNFHPFIFLMALSSVLILNIMPNVKMKVLLGMVFLVTLGVWTYIINSVQIIAHQEQVYAKIQNITGQYPGLPMMNVSLVEKTQPFGLIHQEDFGDELSKKIRNSYISRGYVIVGSYISPFNFLPTSTLNTYLDRNIYILYKPHDSVKPSAIKPDVNSNPNNAQP